MAEEPSTVISVPASSLAGPLPPAAAGLTVRVVNPLVVVFVRALRAFLQSTLGLLTADSVVQLLPANDFVHRLMLCASFSVAVATINLLQNAVELLARFDQQHPLISGGL